MSMSLPLIKFWKKRSCSLSLLPSCHTFPDYHYNNTSICLQEELSAVLSERAGQVGVFDLWDQVRLHSRHPLPPQPHNLRLWRQREDGSEERFQMFLHSRERQVRLCQLQPEVRHYQGGSLPSQQQEVWPDPTKESPPHPAGRSAHLADKSKKVSVRSQEELP